MSWKKAIVGLLLIGGIVAVALPLFVRVDVASSSSCLANLKQIQGAVEQWALENRITNAAHRVTIADISGGADKYIKQSINAELKCSAGGTYSVTTVGEEPRCSVAGHSL